MKINKLFLAALLISSAGSIYADSYYHSDSYSNPYSSDFSSYPYSSNYSSYPYSSDFNSYPYSPTNSYPISTDYNYSSDVNSTFYPTSSYQGNFYPTNSYQGSNLRIDSNVTPIYNQYDRGTYFDRSNVTNLRDERNLQDYNRYNQPTTGDSLHRTTKTFTDRDTTSEYRSNYATNNTNYTVSDDDRALVKKIQTAIAGPDYTKNITVDVDNGIVTLRGKVRNQNEKFALDQKVKTIQGVRNVNNQIEVHTFR